MTVTDELGASRSVGDRDAVGRGGEADDDGRRVGQREIDFLRSGDHHEVRLDANRAVVSGDSLRAERTPAIRYWPEPLTRMDRAPGAPREPRETVAFRALPKKESERTAELPSARETWP